MKAHNNLLLLVINRWRYFNFILAYYKLVFFHYSIMKLMIVDHRITIYLTYRKEGIICINLSNFPNAFFFDFLNMNIKKQGKMHKCVTHWTFTGPFWGFRKWIYETMVAYKASLESSMK